MKRFQWPLQQLLEVTIQRELVLRAELFRLARDITAVHQEIFRRKASLRAAIAQLAELDVNERLPRQQVFMWYSAVEESHLAGLRGVLADLQRQRSEKMAAFKKANRSRETLDRLREEALRRHTREALKQEQKQLDESSQVAFARKLIARRAGGPG